MTQLAAIGPISPEERRRRMLRSATTAASERNNVWGVPKRYKLPKVVTLPSYSFMQMEREDEKK